MHIPALATEMPINHEREREQQKTEAHNLKVANENHRRDQRAATGRYNSRDDIANPLQSTHGAKKTPYLPVNHDSIADFLKTQTEKSALREKAATKSLLDAEEKSREHEAENNRRRDQLIAQASAPPPEAEKEANKTGAAQDYENKRNAFAVQSTLAQADARLAATRAATEAAKNSQQAQSRKDDESRVASLQYPATDVQDALRQTQGPPITSEITQKVPWHLRPVQSPTTSIKTRSFIGAAETQQANSTPKPGTKTPPVAYSPHSGEETTAAKPISHKNSNPAALSTSRAWTRQSAKGEQSPQVHVVQGPSASHSSDNGHASVESINTPTVAESPTKLAQAQAELGRETGTKTPDASHQSKHGGEQIGRNHQESAAPATVFDDSVDSARAEEAGNKTPGASHQSRHDGEQVAQTGRNSVETEERLPVVSSPLSVVQQAQTRSGKIDWSKPAPASTSSVWTRNSAEREQSQLVHVVNAPSESLSASIDTPTVDNSPTKLTQAQVELAREAGDKTPDGQASHSQHEGEPGAQHSSKPQTSKEENHINASHPSQESDIDTGAEQQRQQEAAKHAELERTNILEKKKKSIMDFLENIKNDADTMTEEYKSPPEMSVEESRVADQVFKQGLMECYTFLLANGGGILYEGKDMKTLHTMLRLVAQHNASERARTERARN